MTDKERATNEQDMRDSGAELYMRCRVATWGKMGLIDRRTDVYGAAWREWWGRRFIAEYNQAPIRKARERVCR